MSDFAFYRGRILRKSPQLRTLVAETRLGVEDLVVPLFVHADSQDAEIHAIPGYSRLSVKSLVREVQELAQLGINAVLLFAKIADNLKDNTGKEALNKQGLLPTAIRAIKNACPEMLVMTDIALDPYSIYGHDGIVNAQNEVDNDATLAVLAEMAVVHAEAGADVVAPSDMMDGRVRAIRLALEAAHYPHCAIMSYTAKYASALYGPFRHALDSAPGFGDKQGYQMDKANLKEALKEAEWDYQEGADILLVKPANYYLDVIYALSEHSVLPVAAYQVSGEYAMIHLAAQAKLASLEQLMLESLIAIKRAGAKILISYFAKKLAVQLRNNP